MESNKDKINNLPILEVLNTLGYRENSHYKIQGNNIRMKDSKGLISDGWIGNIRENRLFCKSGIRDGRFEGDIIGIIKGALGCEPGEAIKWAENAFNLDKILLQPNIKKEEFMDKKWHSLSSELSQTQIDYLNNRGIKYNEHIKKILKSEDGLLVLPIQTSNLSVKALQKRESKEVEKKFRYKIEKPSYDADGSGIFIYFSDKNNKTVYIVEGFSDFLTIASLGVNVIGLVSALAGVQYLKDFHKNYNLIYISDNDEAGRLSGQKLIDIGIRFGHYKIDIDDIKDVNDFWVYSSNMGINGEDFIKIIYNDADKPRKNIHKALDKAIRNRDTKSRKIGDKVFDSATGGITPGSVLIINGFTGEGKTTTLDWIISGIQKHNKKIAYCSMDDDVGKMLAMFLGRFFKKDWISEIYPNIENYIKEYGEDKFDNFLLYDDIRTLSGFEEIIKDEKINVLIIDYVQIVQDLPGKEAKEKMNYLMGILQKIAKDNHIAIIGLSQTAMGEASKPVLNRNPLESVMIRSTADTFINVGIFNGKHKIAFVKNKYGSTKYKNTEHDTSRDETTGNISIFEDFETIDNGKRKMGL